MLLCSSCGVKLPTLVLLWTRTPFYLMLGNAGTTSSEQHVTSQMHHHSLD